MADNPLDPDYVMKATTNAALERLIQNPAVDPITTPPGPEAFAARRMPQNNYTAPPDVGPGDAPANMMLTAPQRPQKQTMIRISDDELTDEVKEAMAVLQRSDVVDQVDAHTWRVK